MKVYFEGTLLEILNEMGVMVGAYALKKIDTAVSEKLKTTALPSDSPVTEIGRAHV